MSGNDSDYPLAHNTARLSITTDAADAAETRRELLQIFQSLDRRGSVISFEESEELAPTTTPATATINVGPETHNNVDFNALGGLGFPKQSKRRRSSVQSISSLPINGNARKDKEKIHKRKLKKLNEPPSYKITDGGKNRLKVVLIPQLRDLTLFTLIPGNNAPPNWVKVNHKEQINKVVVCFIPGLEFGDFKIPEELAASEENKFFPLKDLTFGDELSFFNEKFDTLMKTTAPGSKDSIYLPFHTFTHVMLTTKEKKKIMEDLKKNRLTLWDLLMSVEDMERYGYPSYPSEHYPEDRTVEKETNEEKITETPAKSNEESQDKGEYGEEKVEEEEEEVKEKEDNEKSSERETFCDEPDANGFVFTKKFTHPGSHTFAIDCEFCLSALGKVLTRISIVNFQGEVVLDKFVKPDEPIIDYVTKYSGITEDKLAGVTTTLRDIQKEFLLMISNEDILIGHSLESDLNVLKIKHPRIIDTALSYEHVRGPPSKPSLKWLADKYLAREIQRGELDDSGHSSVEDATACLDLIKLKLQEGLCFGTNMTEMSIYERLNVSIGHPTKSLVIDYASNNNNSQCLTPDEITNHVKRSKAVNDDEVIEIFEKECTSGDLSLIILKLRELEFNRNWSTPPSTYKPKDDATLTESELFAKLNERLQRIYAALPQNTAFILTPGQGNPSEMYRLQNVRREFQQAERIGQTPTVSWDFDASVKLQEAATDARKTFSFMTVANKTDNSDSS